MRPVARTSQRWRPAQASTGWSFTGVIRHNPGDGWINGTAVAALIAMDERAAGPEVLRMYKEGRIQGGIRGEELTSYFGPLPE